MKKLLFIFGTRPEAIKMLPIINYAKSNLQNTFEIKVCITGQHKEMLTQVLDVFEVVPDYNLAIMQQQQDLYDITANVLLGLRPILKDYQPDCVLVHGDTTTTLAASMAAYYQQIPVAHVEAGLRTHNIYSPWPEEINRTVTGCIAKYHFTPTTQSRDNLFKENITEHVAVVGNSVIDALLWMVNKINSTPNLESKLHNYFIQLGISFSQKIILVTGHRRENFGQGFINICAALKQIAIKYPDVQIIYPVHLNPNVQNIVQQELSELANVYLIAPLEYQYFVYLMMQSNIILTDSGGIQEEALSIGKPVLVMRDTTERPEAVNTGMVKLVGTGIDAIIKNVLQLISQHNTYVKIAKHGNPYGDGNTAHDILDYLAHNL